MLVQAAWFVIAPSSLEGEDSKTLPSMTQWLSTAHPSASWSSHTRPRGTTEDAGSFASSLKDSSKCVCVYINIDIYVDR